MIYFIVGILTGSFGIILINNICDLINTFTEYLKAKIGVGIMKCNAKIDYLQMETKNPKIIGFATTSEKDEIEE